MNARIHKEGDKWTLILVRELRHPPALVWESLTDPKHLSAWAPFDADRALSAPGPVGLRTAGGQVPTKQAEAAQGDWSQCFVHKADKPSSLEYTWGQNLLRWDLTPTTTGTRLTLWHNIDRGYIVWGAAGWHICFNVLDDLLDGKPTHRVAGPAAMQLPEWQQLVKEYAKELT